MDERAHAVYMATLAYQAERYEDVVAWMKKVCELNADLSRDERNLLSAGYENIVTARRTSWRKIHAAEKKEEQMGERTAELLEKIKEFRLKLEAELEEIYKDSINLIDNYLFRPSNEDEAAALYFTIKAEHYGYLAEIKEGDDKQYALGLSLIAYKDAEAIALPKLAASHPVRLSLAVKFSVFLYDICDNAEKARSVAKDAYDQATFDPAEDASPTEAVVQNIAISNGSSGALLLRLEQNLDAWSPYTTEDGDADQ